MVVGQRRGYISSEQDTDMRYVRRQQLLCAHQDLRKFGEPVECPVRSSHAQAEPIAAPATKVAASESKNPSTKCLDEFLLSVKSSLAYLFVQVRKLFLQSSDHGFLLLPAWFVNIVFIFFVTNLSI